MNLHFLFGDMNGPEEDDLGSARLDKGRNRNDLVLIRRDLDRLALAVEAMWELLRDSQGLAQEDLPKKMHEVDMRDGNLDAKNKSHQLKACPKCGRVLQIGTPKCIYCGQEVFLDPF